MDLRSLEGPSACQASTRFSEVGGAKVPSTAVWKRMPVTVQATPFTTDQVVFLEKAAVEAGDPRNRCLSGFASWCLHARMRVGDAVSARVEPFFDAPVGEDGGFIATEVTRHKTAPRVSRKPLPCVCLADGISGANWAEGWLEYHAAMGFDAAPDRCLQMSPREDGSCYGAVNERWLTEGRWKNSGSTT